MFDLTGDLPKPVCRKAETITDLPAMLPNSTSNARWVRPTFQVVD